MTPSQRALFVRASPAPLRAALACLDDLPDRVEACWRAARAAWPGLALDRAAFVRALAARLDATRSAEAALAAIAAPDLLLATAALAGDRAAITALVEHCFAVGCAVAARLDRSPAFVADVQQLMMIRLLLGGPDGVPRLGHYRAAGPLRAFLRASATRVALNLRRHERRLAARSRAAADLVDATWELDDAAADRRFERALTEAICALDPAQRALLRRHHLEGRSIDELGAELGIHRATAARRIAAVRDELRAQVCRALADPAPLGGRAPDLRALVAALAA